MVRRENVVNKRRRRSREQEQTQSANEPSMDFDGNLLIAGETQSHANSEDLKDDIGHSKPSPPHFVPDNRYGEQLEPRIDTFDFLNELLETELPAGIFAPITLSTSTPDPTPSSTTFTPSNSSLPQEIAGISNQLCLPRVLDKAAESSGVGSVHTNETPMQRLSRLDYELISILTQHDKRWPEEFPEAPNEAKALLAYPPIMDQALARTTDFVNLLKGLVDSSSFTSIALQGSQRHDSIHGSGNMRRNSVAISDSEYDSSGDSETDHLNPPNET